MSGPSVSSEDGSGKGRGVASSSVLQVNHHGDHRSFRRRVAHEESMDLGVSVARGCPGFAGGGQAASFSFVGHTVLHGMFQTLEYGLCLRKIVFEFVQSQAAISCEQFQRRDLDPPIAE